MDLQPAASADSADPFNILASLGIDIDLPIVPVMPAILGTTPDYVGCAYRTKEV